MWACGILVPRPGIEPRPLAVRGRSLNYWAAREVPLIFSLNTVSLPLLLFLLWIVELLNLHFVSSFSFQTSHLLHLYTLLGGMSWPQSFNSHMPSSIPPSAVGRTLWSSASSRRHPGCPAAKAGAQAQLVSTLGPNRLRGPGLAWQPWGHRGSSCTPWSWVPRAPASVPWHCSLPNTSSWRPSPVGMWSETTCEGTQKSGCWPRPSWTRGSSSRTTSLFGCCSRSWKMPSSITGCYVVSPGHLHRLKPWTESIRYTRWWTWMYHLRSLASPRGSLGSSSQWPRL